MHLSVILHKLIVEKETKNDYQVDMFLFLINATQNRMLYYFAEQFRNDCVPEMSEILKDIYEEGKDLLRSKKKTLNLISEIAQALGMDYRTPKSCRNYPYINADIDLLVKEKDYENWIKEFEKRQFIRGEHKTFMKTDVMQNILKRRGFYKIDITTQFNWQQRQYFDTKFIWEESREADFLINLGAIAFKRMSFNLLDILYLKNMLHEGLDTDILNQQVRKYGWELTFDEVIRLINSLDPKVVYFPYLFPLRSCFIVFLESIKRSSFPFNYFVYFVLARMRYVLMGRKFLPFHVYWYPYHKLKKIKNVKITL